MIDFDRNGIDIKYKKEMVRLVDDYFADDSQNGSIYKYVLERASEGLARNMKERSKYLAEKRAEGIIVN